MLLNKEIRAGGFSGFYYSIYTYDDEIYDDEINLKDEIINEYNINDDEIKNNIDISINYNNEYEDAIKNEYVNNYFNELTYIINDILFKYDYYKIDPELNIDYDLILNKNEIILIKPRYYNYKHDEIIFNIKIKDTLLKIIINHIFNNCYNEFKQFLYNNFTSYDGFISFYSNNIKVWRNKNYKEYDLNELTAFFNFLLLNNNKEIYNILNFNTVSNISIYEYLNYRYIYYNDYFNYNEFIKAVLKDLNRV